MPSDVEIAWFAGIFEGEGTFETSKRSTVRMTVGMTDRDVIERMQSIFPGRPIVTRDDDLTRAKFPTAKPIYVWRSGNHDSVALVVTAILPWLGARRSTRALEVLAHIENRQLPGQPRTSHCKQGHALTPENLVRRGGAKPYVRCKTCAVEQQRAYVIRRRAAALS
jgi:hypothetical protein